MQESHPSFVLLLLSGLMIFWLLPLSSYLMLKGQRDENARIWFRGAWLYALVVTSFIFTALLPPWLAGPATLAVSTSSVLCFLEALRREVRNTDTPLKAYVLLVALELGVLLVLQHLGIYEKTGRAVHLSLISVLDGWVGLLALAVRRQQGGRALYLVSSVFLVFVVVNLLRVLEVVLTGHYSELRSFSLTASLGLLTNYLGGIFYCYGYWGFVLEKERKKEARATETTLHAQAQERLAQERQRVAEETLAERNALMEQVASMGKLAQSGAMSAALTHEFSQPLASILLNVQQALALTQAQSTATVLQPLLKRAEGETLRATDTLMQVKAMFRSGPPKLALVDPNAVLAFVVAMMDRSLQEARVAVDIRPEPGARVLFSVGQLEHVLLNLFQNAVESLRSVHSGPRRILARVWEEESQVKLSVEDNGPGIAVELEASIFDLSFSTKGQNMGMGLWLARYVMERHDGMIGLASNQPGACEFVLALPMATQAPTADDLSASLVRRIEAQPLSS